MKTQGSETQEPPSINTETENTETIIKVEESPFEKMHRLIKNAINWLRQLSGKFLGIVKTQFNSINSIFNNNFFSAQKKKAKKWNIKRIALVLLGCGLAINLVSIYLQLSGDYLAVTEKAKAAVSLWVTSVILAGVSAWLYSVPVKKSKKKKKEDNKQPVLSSFWISTQTFFLSKPFLYLAPILLLAFILRIIPILNNGLYLDEWYWLDTAKLIPKGTVFSPFGFIGDQPSNLPAFPLAFLLSIFRNPLLCVRLTGVIYSLITIIFVYQLLMEILGRKAAIVGALLLTTSVWDIHNSNLGWNNVNLNPMLVSGILLILYRVYKKEYTVRTFFALALLLSICLHLLYVAVLLIIPTLVVMARHIIKNHTRRRLRDLLLFIVFLGICLSPMLPKLIEYPQPSIGRHSEFIQQNINLSEETKSPVSYYWEQLIFLFQDYTQGKNNFPQEGLWGITLDPPIQLLSSLGILLIVIQVIRKKSDSFWLIIITTLGVLILIPFVLLYRTTSVWRAYIVLPIIYLLVTYSLYQFAKLSKFVAKEYVYDRKGWLTIFLTAFVILYYFASYRWYINSFQVVYQKKSASYESTICQYASNLINKKIPRGSTILFPEEMCYPLVTILYEDDQYLFVPIQAEGPKPSIVPGSYIYLLNSQIYTGYFNKNIQETAKQIITENNAELISFQSDSQPVLYLIK